MALTYSLGSEYNCGVSVSVILLWEEPLFSTFPGFSLTRDVGVAPAAQRNRVWDKEGETKVQLAISMETEDAEMGQGLLEMSGSW